MSALSSDTLVDVITAYVHGSDHPDLMVYRKDFGTKFDIDRWAAILAQRCRLGDFFGKRILEVGCGFGWDAAGIALIGNNSVVATDILPSMIEGARECLASVRKAGYRLDIEPVQGDICALELPDASIDGIYSSEAIEHVHDLPAMFRRCFALLKPGGRMLIANDANQYNSEFREATMKMWKERDESWEHAAWLKAEVRPVEHATAKPFAAMREEIIDETGVTLNAESRAQLIAATAGLTRPEIVEAVRQYVELNTLPARPAFSWCRNPETGEYAERLLDPFELREMITEAGFRGVRLRHEFNRFPHRLVNGVSLSPLNKFLFDRRGVFLLVADKPG